MKAYVDGTVTLFRYNGAGDLIEQIILNKQGDLLDKFAYSYDNKGNITAIKSAAGTTQYVYDSLDQLTKETRPDGTIYEYTYDATGNRLTQKVTKGSDIKTTTYTYDDADQLMAVGGKNQTYDDNGNLTNDSERTYVYDAENRLTAVKDKDGNTIVSFTYRADGMRKTMTTGSKTTTFHYDENKNVTHETDGNNQVIASYTYADDQPISMTRGGKTYYYQTNYRGDVVALTDSAGAVVATYEYDAYGNLLKETGNVENPYRYAGYRYDGETGLYYLQSRYYNPETGRFLTRDTFEGLDEEPLSQNKYAYGHNNPIMNVDPTGFAIPAVISWLVTNIIVALVWTITQMAWNYGWKKKWPRGAFVETFIWNFVSSAVPVAGWLRFIAKPIKGWIGKFGRSTLRWIGNRIIFPVINWLKPKVRNARSIAKQGARKARGAVGKLVRKAYKRVKRWW